MKTASERAAELNAETRAWVAEDPGNRGAGLLVEDASHWASYNIHTADELDCYLAWCTYVNLYKEIHGIKLRWESLEGLTLSEIEAKIASLEDEVYAPDGGDPEPLTHSPFADLKL